ncbi:trans-sulfuration enzyme family protein [Phenylobacterium aquaticum]|uniref:trans-sulfuration enzyme family protein n=1 Tax=Phenylobacterium aquaticum TaxID=1763816 RepID=UPI001F5D2D61|nr:PLP-dependent transferase [Phenylobacterium aquaticum]MCI3132835.1 PLP-dependent transferase [Phenylobacterium aquaticum]
MRDETLCLKGADDENAEFDSLVVPVHRASTVVFRTVEAYQRRREAIYDGYSYGLYGTPTSRALERRIALIEDAAKTLVLPSGFAAIVATTLACAASGQCVLFPDNAYDTVRPFALNFLAGLGIRAVFYDPMLGAAVGDLMTDDVSLVWVESPGSVTMEVQDVPAIVAAVHRRGAKVAADNTWATPLRFKPLQHGVDFSVCAVSKYLGGHSDVVMGCVSVADEALYRRLKDFSRYMGYGVSPDDCSLVLRGMETLAVRLDRSEANALALAGWLSEQAFVREVRHPALAGNPGHAVWRRDFAGATGVFSVFLHPWTRNNLARGVEALQLFAIGASWGGTRSLLAVLDGGPTRSATPLGHDGPILRFSIGLEHLDDLRADLIQGLAQFGEAPRSGSPPSSMTPESLP